MFSSTIPIVKWKTATGLRPQAFFLLSSVHDLVSLQGKDRRKRHLLADFYFPILTFVRFLTDFTLKQVGKFRRKGRQMVGTRTRGYRRIHHSQHHSDFQQFASAANSYSLVPHAYSLLVPSIHSSWFECPSGLRARRHDHNRRRRR